MQRRPLLLSGLLLLLLAIFGGCATTLPPAQIIRTLFSPTADDMQFGNILVISVAGDYAQRARFEQSVSSALIASGGSASPYYAVIGRAPLVTRSNINTAIQNRRFDGVLFIRLQGQDIPNAAPGRPTGRKFQLFLYDYGEFNQPAPLPQSSALTFVSEFYRSLGETKVWAVDSLSVEHKDTEEALSIQINSIAQQVIEDELLAN